MYFHWNTLTNIFYDKVVNNFPRKYDILNHVPAIVKIIIALAKLKPLLSVSIEWHIKAVATYW